MYYYHYHAFLQDKINSTMVHFDGVLGVPKKVISYKDYKNFKDYIVKGTQFDTTGLTIGTLTFLGENE